jgi:hypothetical protein
MTDCCAGFRPQCSEVGNIAIIGCIPDNCTFVFNRCSTFCHIEDPSGCSAPGENTTDWLLFIDKLVVGFVLGMLLLVTASVILMKLKCERESFVDDTVVDDDMAIRLEESSSNSTDSQV